jgi:hypothetical protein
MAGLEWLTYDDFAPHVGDRFDVSVPDGEPLVLELVDATQSSAAGGPGPTGEERHQFSLVFRGPSAPVLAQGTRELSQDELGELALFLVPIGSDAEGMRYEAAFA